MLRITFYFVHHLGLTTKLYKNLIKQLICCLAAKKLAKSEKKLERGNPMKEA
jgi:hypothetical protein